MTLRLYIPIDAGALAVGAAFGAPLRLQAAE